MRLEGKVALITGMGHAIGQETALLFAQEGAHVAVSAIHHFGRAESVRDQIHRLGRRAIAVQADVTRTQDVSLMVSETVEQLGGLDILVNCAGGVVGPFVGAEEVTEEDWDRTLHLNLKSHFLCCRASVPHMKGRGGGRIVNVSSLAGIRGSGNKWPAVAYCVAKAAAIGLTKQLALELSDLGIRVNAVAHPDPMQDTLSEYFKDISEEEFTAEYAKYPLRRPARPAEIAGVILFLSSDLSSYMTGETVVISGGSYLALLA